MSSRGKKKKALNPHPEMTAQEKLKLLYKNGITAFDLKCEFERGYRMAQTEMVKTCYAAVCLALKETMHFGKERILRVLISMDEKIVTTIDSEEIMNETFDRTGIKIDFSQSMSRDRITRKDE